MVAAMLAEVSRVWLISSSVMVTGSAPAPMEMIGQ
jgi:hypothetical protein